jgi:hypothetical protein
MTFRKRPTSDRRMFRSRRGRRFSLPAHRRTTPNDLSRKMSLYLDTGHEPGPAPYPLSCAPKGNAPVHAPGPRGSRSLSRFGGAPLFATVHDVDRLRLPKPGRPETDQQGTRTSPPPARPTGTLSAGNPDKPSPAQAGRIPVSNEPEHDLPRPGRPEPCQQGTRTSPLPHRRPEPGQQ